MTFDIDLRRYNGSAFSYGVLVVLIKLTQANGVVEPFVFSSSVDALESASHSSYVGGTLMI